MKKKVCCRSTVRISRNHDNATYDSQMQNTIVLRLQLQLLGTLTQPSLHQHFAVTQNCSIKNTLVFQPVLSTAHFPSGICNTLMTQQSYLIPPFLQPVFSGRFNLLPLTLVSNSTLLNTIVFLFMLRTGCPSAHQQLSFFSLVFIDFHCFGSIEPSNCVAPVSSARYLGIQTIPAPPLTSTDRSHCGRQMISQFSPPYLSIHPSIYSFCSIEKT